MLGVAVAYSQGINKKCAYLPICLSGLDMPSLGNLVYQRQGLDEVGANEGQPDQWKLLGERGQKGYEEEWECPQTMFGARDERKYSTSQVTHEEICR